MTLKIAYMTGEYPRATDTFIQREVADLRLLGAEIQTFAIRRPAVKENVGPEQQAERDRTNYILPAGPIEILKAHASLLLKSPGRYLGALWTALTVRSAGLKPLVWQFAYFLEAGIVARRIVDRGIPHLHNHFSNSSCSVAMLAAELGGFTFSFTMHGPAEFYEPKYWRIDEKIRRAKFVACISNFARSQAMVFADQRDWSKLHVIHCGVRPGEYLPVNHAGEGNRLLFVGRLAAVKGLPILLESLSQLVKDRPAIVLTIAGDGPDREALSNQAKSLGIESNVRFLGYQSQSAVRELLQQTDVFVMASFAEGVPVVLMEALAAGVPVVATRIAGVPELVEDRVNGYLVPPSEPVALAGAIDALVSDSALRARFGAAGREKVAKDFDVSIEAGKLRQILAGELVESLGR